MMQHLKSFKQSYILLVCCVINFVGFVYFNNLITWIGAFIIVLCNFSVALSLTEMDLIEEKRNKRFRNSAAYKRFYKEIGSERNDP